MNKILVKFRVAYNFVYKSPNRKNTQSQCNVLPLRKFICYTREFQHIAISINFKFIQDGYNKNPMTSILFFADVVICCSNFP